ncbi:LuxR C-terminal-related transcriptional regulator [Cesiribacter sp. SM1]|uniref:LuxR C-terminal-related transcriptional regulator n=1 Tax=Cesiribacter sp. SM1 TaxID=2861196 RepID=UPI001CD21C7F|nr:LuxR C-terminal-related transcriptional regulator [Cesiribacter sp. SM1]
MRKLTADPGETAAFELSLENAGPLNAVLSAGPVIVSIFNHLTFKYDYISPNVESIIGIPAVAFKQLDHRKFLEMHMHPHDMEIVALKLMPDIVGYICEHKGKDVLKFSFHYNYRIKTASGKWLKIDQQSSALKLDNKGKIILEQSFYAQAGEADFAESHPIKLLISYRNGHGYYETCLSRTYLHNKVKAGSLTPREIEILVMLANGNTSSEIAEALHISETTIMTHRRNMLHKLKLKNTNELVAWAFHAGLL